ncbi:MAG: ATP-dependent Clp protease ATP-binding subunit [Candidatus Pacebacteria bacterium]|nr:ATP-dependent Clp protease ATP-binding subunit [Candidatus Paceibacterota bacterium]
MYVVQTEIERYRASLALERLLSRRMHRVIIAVLGVIAVVLLGVLVVLAFVAESVWMMRVTGVLSMVLGLLLACVLLRFFHNAYFYRGFRSIIGLAQRPMEGIAYEIARALEGYTADCTQGFLRAPLGQEIMFRCGLSAAQVETFLQSDARIVMHTRGIVLPKGRMFMVSDIATTLYDEDASFARFLEGNGVTEHTYRRAVYWATQVYYAQKQKSRWWGKDNLSRTTGIGHDWSYGIAYLLNRFSVPIAQGAVFTGLGAETTYAAAMVEQLEEILARAQDANSMLVGAAGVGKMDIIHEVAERARTGDALGAVAGKHFIALNVDLLLASYPQKHELEQALILLLNQAAHAGNVVLVIADMPAFIRGAAAISVDVPHILDGYLGAPSLHIIATATTGAYHRELEVFEGFVRRFETIFVAPPDLLGTENLLMGLARRFERSHGVVLTYPALHAIVEGADRYITNGVMPDKAVQLLVEVMGAAQSRTEPIIQRAFVESYIHERTGIPVGPMQDAEREQLLHLEDVLHERVVGQDTAIAAISSAMRRARAGIQDSEKPMGTFLFVGPTGVGKTETAKALAAVFFKREDVMVRFDMSEYGATDGAARLIGTRAAPGALASAMKQYPYAVLLLDEFEKAHSAVHDLFLQILDEGYFTDARGSRINMRNTIIIATSNAGSQYILEAVDADAKEALDTDALVDQIIAQGAYKPELINRFDSVVLFEPLTYAQQKVIAGFMLRDLETRIRTQGYILNVTDILQDTLASRGYDPKFGARPMRRVLQDVIEEAIAQKIISGGLQKGDTITLTAEDIARVG